MFSSLRAPFDMNRIRYCSGFSIPNRMYAFPRRISDSTGSDAFAPSFSMKASSRVKCRSQIEKISSSLSRKWR